MMKANRTMISITLLGLLLPTAWAVQNIGTANEASIEVDRPARILNDANSLVGTTKNDRPADAGNVLRCWQHGRLLYEGDGFSRLASSAKSTVTVVARKKGEGVSIINLNDGFCMLTDD